MNKNISCNEIYTINQTNYQWRIMIHFMTDILFTCDQSFDGVFTILIYPIEFFVFRNKIDFNSMQLGSLASSCIFIFFSMLGFDINVEFTHNYIPKDFDSSQIMIKYNKLDFYLNNSKINAICDDNYLKFNFSNNILYLPETNIVEFTQNFYSEYYCENIFKDIFIHTIKLSKYSDTFISKAFIRFKKVSFNLSSNELNSTIKNNT